MSRGFEAGDFLVFQLEAGFALIRLLGIEDGVWHVVGYDDLFPDVDGAEMAVATPDKLSVSHHHMAITTRAFESTQTAKIGHSQVTDHENAVLAAWRNSPDRQVSDKSVRLLMGLR
jgi:hypothetical protein